MSPRIRFGPFELNLQTGELWKHGTKVRLQGKPFQVLVALLERPGEPVSREELQQRLWSGDTFVDFERGLNTAANRLRLTLGDSAENPRYVETLARSGYRFVARVESVTIPATPATAFTSPEPVAAPQPQPAALPIPPTVPAAGPASAKGTGWAILAVATVLIGVALWWALRRPIPETPTFQQVTFGRGMVASARFAADGQTILYSAKWESEPWKLYLASSVSPETRSLEFEGSMLTAVSRSDELALLSKAGWGSNLGSTLSRVPLNGGSPLPVADRVVCGDWSPDGKDLAVARFQGRRSQLEFPIGKVLYVTASQLGCPRISPDGKQIAFSEYPGRGDAYIKAIDLNGNVRTLSGGWSAASGLDWSASGKEVWFTASRTSGAQALWGVTMAGKLRLIFQAPGSLRLDDVSPDGAVLLSELDRRVEMAGRTSSDKAARDLSWFDFSSAEDLSPDGNLVLFDEGGQGGGPHWTVYLRRLDDGATLRLAEGHALALAPDGKSALILDVKDRRRVSLVPVGQGTRREIAGGGIEYRWARFFPDGQRLLVGGNKPGGSLGLFVQSIKGGKAMPLAPQTYLRGAVISPDGKQVAGNDPDNNLVILPVEGGAARLVDAQPYGIAVGWSADGSALLVRDLGIAPVHVNRVELASGRVKPWSEIEPIHPTGVQSLNRLFYSRDGQSYVYSINLVFSKLYLVSGLK